MKDKHKIDLITFLGKKHTYLILNELKTLKKYSELMKTEELTDTLLTERLKRAIELNLVIKNNSTKKYTLTPSGSTFMHYVGIACISACKFECDKNV